MKEAGPPPAQGTLAAPAPAVGAIATTIIISNDVIDPAVVPEKKAQETQQSKLVNSIKTEDKPGTTRYRGKLVETPFDSPAAPIRHACMHGSSCKSSLSGYMAGVTYRALLSRLKPWYASIKVKGSTHHLGFFETDEAAAKAYDKAAKEHHKEKAILNFTETGELGPGVLLYRDHPEPDEEEEEEGEIGMLLLKLSTCNCRSSYQLCIHARLTYSRHANPMQQNPLPSSLSQGIPLENAKLSHLTRGPRRIIMVAAQISRWTRRRVRGNGGIRGSRGPPAASTEVWRMIKIVSCAWRKFDISSQLLSTMYSEFHSLTRSLHSMLL